MAIYINGRFLTQKITGVQRYAIEVVKKIDELNLNEEIILLHPKNVLQKIELKNIKFKKIGSLTSYMWEQITLPFYLLFKKNAKLLNLCNIAPILFPGSVVLHDISFKTHSDHLSKKFKIIYNLITNLNIKRYNHIFTNSKFSKNEIMKAYNIKDKEIDITYCSAEHMKNIIPDFDILKKLDLEDKEFVFSLGSNSPHKNRKYILECAKHNNNIIFVISGTSNDVFKTEEQEKLKNVIFTGYLSDNEIVALYKKCAAFLFPSLYEGFGIPPLEAMECGCKNIIVSDIPVLKEIYGESVKYIDVMDSKNQFSEVYKYKIKNNNCINKNYLWNEIAKKIMEEI